jgi:hypothetical protein
MLGAAGVLALGASFAQGCSKTTTAEIQDAGGGTYTIGINRTSSYLSEGGTAIAAAVNKAGAHCHAKGQKFMLKSAVGKQVVFRCVGTSAGTPQAAAEPAPLSPPPAAAQSGEPLPLPPLPQQ